MWLCGSAQNVEIANYVLRYLLQVFGELAAAQRRRTGCRALKPYLLGLAAGLSRRLRQERQRASQYEGVSTALVALGQDLERQCAAKYGQLSSDKGFRAPEPTVEACLQFAAGTRDGRQIEIRPGLARPTTQRQLFAS